MNIARRIERMESRIGDGSPRCRLCGQPAAEQTARIFDLLARSGPIPDRCPRCGLPPAPSKPATTEELIERLNAIAAEWSG